jgi:L-2-hydroxyglutarate oxidase LhgO
MPDQRRDILVIGGGIVGLATALALSTSFPHLRLLLVEKEDRVARHQSGHSSGVIHSGIYYPPGSLKAKLCVQGAMAMIAFCREHGIKHEICGKVIVATAQDELPRLQALLGRASANGLRGATLLAQEQVRELEPHCGGLGGLHIPSTGIVDYVEVCEKYAELIARNGGSISTSTKVLGFVYRDNTTVVETNRGSIEVPYVINCAGLHSDRVSRLAGERPEVAIVPFRGEYYDLIPEREHLVRGLIYPVPDPRFPFLGVHFTRRIHGGVDVGPNAVLALKREGYRWNQISVRDAAGTFAFPGFWRLAGTYWRYGAGEMYRSLNKRAFVRALKRLVPEIQASDLVADGSGVRAQALKRDGSLIDDFQFVRKKNMLHVYNVPSPAATASIAIGQAITKMAEEEFDLKSISNG